MTTALDRNRIPVEIARALAANGYLVEVMEPGLSVRIYADKWVVLDCFGAEVAEVPTYRLREVDAELLRQGAMAALQEVPVHVRDQVAAAINAGDIVLDAPADSDWVFLSANDFALMAAHRSCVVDGWPAEDE